MKTLSQVRDYLWTLCKTNVSATVYVSDKPSALPDNISDFVVVSTPMAFRETTDKSGLMSIIRGTVMVELFVKDNSKGIEDTKKMNIMEQAFYGVLNTANENGYHLSLRRVYTAPRFENYHITVITLDLITT